MSGSRRLHLALFLSLVLVATACGTRMPDEAFVAAARSGEDGSADRLAGGGGAAGEEGGGEGGQTVDTRGSATTAPRRGAAGGGTAGGAATQPGATAGAQGGAEQPAAQGGQPNTASDVGVTATSITIGNITSIGGPLGAAFSPSLRGAQAYFARLNELGGVNGRKIEFLTCDDKEDRTRAAQCARDLVEGKKIFAFVANNTRAYGGAARYVNEQGVPDVAGFPITNAYYKYPHSYTIYGTGYQRDGATVGENGKLYVQTGTYRWFKQELNINRAALFYYDIDESRQAGQFLRDGLQMEGIEVVYYGGGSERGENVANPAFDTDVVQMRNNDVEGIWDAMDDGANRKLCEAMDRYGFTVKAKVSLIVAWGQVTGRTFSSPCRDSIYITGDSRPYSDTSHPAVREFRDAMGRYQPKVELHQWGLEGYAAAKWITDGIASMGPNPTRAGLEQWLNTIRDYSNGELFTPQRDYRPIQYEGNHADDCFVIVQWQDAAGTFVPRAPFYTCYDAPYYSYTPLESGD